MIVSLPNVEPMWSLLPAGSMGASLSLRCYDDILVPHPQNAQKPASCFECHPGLGLPCQMIGLAAIHHGRFVAAWLSPHLLHLEDGLPTTVPRIIGCIEGLLIFSFS